MLIPGVDFQDKSDSGTDGGEMVYPQGVWPTTTR